ncbi:MAG: deoxyguanosinetriphosphate triphosphohydrolase, partial [Candidatus Atribacteria bacterium]|nr:deoxyguanosinetriphosphate triphosphohydrolase [Candidatus Atribacteria bacterium]
MVDKIAYVGKDIEDALEVGVIKEQNVPPKFMEALGTTNGQIIGRFVESIVKESYGKDYIAISHELGDLLHELIQFNGKYIYHSDQAELYKSQANKTIEY